MGADWKRVDLYDKMGVSKIVRLISWLGNEWDEGNIANFKID